MSPARKRYSDMGPNHNASEAKPGFNVMAQLEDLRPQLSTQASVPAHGQDVVSATEPPNSADELAKTTAEASPANRKRTSNMLIDRDLNRRALALATRLGRSHGELLIMAVEAEHDTVKPGQGTTQIGGGLFAPRAAVAAKSTSDDATTGSEVFTFRLREADFAVLDQLVEDRGFSNRKELVSACLKAYCDRQQVD